MKSCSIRLAIILAMCISGASQAAIYTTQLTGPNESPPNASPGVGNGVINFDLATHSFNINMNFSGLTGTTTASHIHCCTVPTGTALVAMVATRLPTFAGFPLGVTNGSYNQTFNTLNSATWNPDFVTARGGTLAGAEAALAAGLSAGTSYLNIHTSTFSGGEIRGFLRPAATSQVPEPSALALFAISIGGLIAARRKRAKSARR